MRLFAHKIDEVFRDIFPSKVQVKMCGDEPVVPVEVEIDENGDYFGWLETGETDPVPGMIFEHLVLLKICFPYGMQAEIDAGKGRMVKLSIKCVSFNP